MLHIVEAKKVWKVDSGALLRLQNLRTKQDQNARVMGHLAIEHANAELRVMAELLITTDETQRQNLFAKMGAAQFEYMKARTQFMGAVWAAQQEQKQTGENAIRALGLPVDVEEFTIRIDDGLVLKLIAGEYVEEF